MAAISFTSLLNPESRLTASIQEQTTRQRSIGPFRIHAPSAKPSHSTQNPLVLNLLTESRMEVIKMNRFRQPKELQAGKVGWILLWALGVPIPLLLILFLMRGCT